MNYSTASHPYIRAKSVALLILFFGLLAATPVYASGTVTNCANDTDFSAKLAGGGTVTFSCGTASISFTGTKTISTNTIIDGGGAITLSGGFGSRLFTVNNGVTLTLQNIKLVNGYNSSSAGGGAITNYGHLILNNVTVQNMPDSAYNGGAIATYGALDIANSTFTNNKATNGGAIYAGGTGAIVSIQSSRFEHNQATGVVQNTSGFGGAIFANTTNTTVSIQSSTFYNNTANDGGAIYVNGSTVLNLQASTLSENAALLKGGALLNNASATLTDVTIHNNGNSVQFSGGGIFNYKTLTLSSVTLSQNASAHGPGIVNYQGTANLTNVTLSGNTSTAYTGALDNYQATMNLTNVTLARNTRGILNQPDANTHLSLKNVIIANSTAENCLFDKAPDTSDHNLASDATCFFGVGRDSVNVKLGPLETNGGATLTHRLKPGSPAIDNGVFVGSILTDQRGINYTRPKGTAFDVGAIEFVPCAGTPTKPDLLSPFNGQELTTQVVTLDWTGPDCVKNYSIILRRDNKTGPLLLSKSKIKPTQINTPTLLKFHKYFWRVTACNKAGCATSSWGKFKVQ